MDAEKRASLAPGGNEALAPRQSALQSLLARAAAGLLDESTLTPQEKELAASQAKKRGAAGSLFRLVEREETTFAFQKAGLDAAAALKKAGATGEEAGALTPEMLKTGSWQTVQFRRYNIDVPPTRVPLGRGNPYCAFLARLKDKLASLGFEEFDGPAGGDGVLERGRAFHAAVPRGPGHPRCLLYKGPHARKEHRAAVAGPGGSNARERVDHRAAGVGTTGSTGTSPAG